MTTARSALREAAAAELGIGYIDIAATDTDTDTVNCPAIRDIIGGTDARILEGMFVLNKDDTTAAGQWRSVSSHSYATDDIELTRAWTSSTGDLATIDIYSLLTPTEMNDCIDVALGKLWYRDRASISLDATHNRYSLSSLTWLTDPSQLMELKYRSVDSSDSSKDVREHPVVNRLIEVDADVLAVTLYDIPSSPTSYTLEVVGRHYYEALSTDASTTTCPLPLARAAIKYEFLKKIFNKLGQAAKQNFGMEMVLAENELERVRSRYRQAIVPVELTVEEPFYGPEVPVRDAEFDW